jgi:UDP-N-acetylglucosamine--N-acetylmuramyl-(pentapeptide) pyrophosphoryl-undecaprenol N-acetylglucosamine transferase
MSARLPRLESLAFFGGGSGGHLFPGIAVAQSAEERFPGCRIVFFRTLREIEERVFQGLDFEMRVLELDPPGRGALGWLRFSRAVVLAAREIHSVLGEGFDAAVGLGGYASLPGVLAARAAGVPIILLEQNCVAGRVNRLLAPLVDAVSCSHPEARLRTAGRLAVTGNPVRREVLEAFVRRQAGRLADGRRTVLVVGGSQGAHAINRAIAEALPRLEDFREKIRWIHLTGAADKSFVTDAYRKHCWDARVLEYSTRLPDLLAQSDLVIARAGGTTLSELAVLGVPSVLVPYPHHRDRHQLANAEKFVRAGGSRLVAEDCLDVASLRLHFEEILFSPSTHAAMSRKARALASPGAADAVIDLAVDLKRERCPSAFASSS